MSVYAAFLRCIDKACPNVLARIERRDLDLFRALVEVLQNTAIFMSPDQEARERDLLTRVRCHMSMIHPGAMKFNVELFQLPLWVSTIRSTASFLFQQPARSTDFFKQVYCEAKQSASKERHALISHLTGVSYSLQLDLICALSTWVNPCVGLVMIDWLLGQCAHEDNTQILRTILAVMMSMSNGYAVFLYHSSYVKSRNVSRYLLAFPTLLEVLVKTHQSCIVQLLNDEPGLKSQGDHDVCFQFLDQNVLPELKAVGVNFDSPGFGGHETLASAYCDLVDHSKAFCSDIKGGLFSCEDFRERNRCLPRKIVQLLVFFAQRDDSIDALIEKSIRPIIRGLLSINNAMALYRPSRAYRCVA